MRSTRDTPPPPIPNSFPVALPPVHSHPPRPALVPHASPTPLHSTSAATPAKGWAAAPAEAPSSLSGAEEVTRTSVVGMGASLLSRPHSNKVGELNVCQNETNI